MGYWEGRLGVIDLEATGVDVDTSRIVSACVAILEPDGSVVARWDWLADPGVEIPDDATAVHGITSERARAEGRPAEEVIAEIAQTLRSIFALGLPLAVHNAPYDLSLLDREARRHSIPPIDDPSPVVDPLVIDRALDPDRSAKRTLQLTAEHYGVDAGDAHDAGDDALAVGRIAQAIAARHPDALGDSWDDLHRKQQRWYAEQAAEFQDHVRSVKGDAEFVANALWPLKPAEDPSVFQDTQPIPAPPLRPSTTVPMFDFTESIPLALEAAAAWTRSGMVPVIPSAGGAPPPPPPPAPVVAPSDSPAEAVIEARAAVPQRVHVAAAIITDSGGRTLLVRKHDSEIFMQAGGKIERGESALAALIREVDEELGLEIDVAETEFLGSFEAPAANEPGATVRAEVFAFSIATEPVAGAEIAELVWLESAEGVTAPLAPLTRDVLLPIWTERRRSVG